MNSEYLKKVLSCVTTKYNVEIERI
jgi:hypothetical protein